MHFSFTVQVEVERTQGKFASREDLEQQLIEAIGEADPSSLTGDAGGQYEITDWAVDVEAELPKPKTIKRP